VIGMAVPSYSRFVASSRVTDQSSELVGLLTLARSEAIKRNSRITVCGVASATATSCPGGDFRWGFWIMLAPTGVTASADGILRRGTFNGYNNTVRVNSSLTNETIDFTPDGLASTGTGLVNGHWFTVCSTRYSSENVRRLTLGASSRITNSRESATCT
jgi:type IV fimbrial biogenesis protein FimT